MNIIILFIFMFGLQYINIFSIKKIVFGNFEC